MSSTEQKETMDGINDNTPADGIAAVNVDAQGRKNMFRRLSTVMDLCEELPAPFREEMASSVADLLGNLEDLAHAFLCTNNSKEDEDYFGLDARRDSEEEVETLIRCFPRKIGRAHV